MKQENGSNCGLPVDPMRWVALSQRVFMHPNWETRLNRVAKLHPEALRYLEIGVKDSAMELSDPQRGAVNRIKWKAKVSKVLQYLRK